MILLLTRRKSLKYFSLIAHYFWIADDVVRKRRNILLSFSFLFIIMHRMLKFFSSFLFCLPGLNQHKVTTRSHRKKRKRKKQRMIKTFSHTKISKQTERRKNMHIFVKWKTTREKLW